MNDVLFLIQHEREAGRIVSIQRFNDDQQAQADSVRLQLELDLVRRRQKHEVVVLEAAAE
jgi:hypothetical protein